MGLTQKTLKERLTYDPESGFFWWKTKTKNGHGRPGERAATRPNANGYYRIRINGVLYFAHRLAWLYVHGEWPDSIDHINGVTTDNRISNLRDVGHGMNLKNQKLRKDNKSGFCGINWDTRRKKWLATIRSNGKSMYVGLFDDIEEAVLAREKANRKHGFHKNHGRRMPA